ncbi:ATP-dependent helicase [Mycoplasma phocimorsus]|uniref:DNA 3'-5' helicase n=1 Tax=Mycoplasma phocimorsus TaxID=3045839 RepID=A0AAJ1UWK5_9MOLU|nr:UvrD-helicase domain-containing protein [Mycoplasma phocimorsus]MDJ1645550.1 3'-5' exonuclease [Mycoplasma phocimorsus]MDJ1646607.1 3'-5' exonuclease [Mycoplasma phocimorsus]MDJ1647119.1 3'-5' exonuclease [Mycoplasma phocimorsus]MDJ1647560.1 3'-5' exonuclease [Mycoplasma phocimorsus]MDJ1648985.1 3'-5' exonuclease [Mycoplasma phocimorsus]
MNQNKQMAEKIISGLNDEQKFAVLHFDSPLRIIASAGSGKTKVITRKILYLINIENVDPSSILAITFTNRAANEMAQRIKSKSYSNSNGLITSTFHSLCAMILRQDIDKIGRKRDFHIVDKKDVKAIINNIQQKLGINNDDLNYKDVIEFIHIAKIKELDLAEYIKDKNNNPDAKLKVKILKLYKEELVKANSLDFHDLLLFTKKLFQENDQIREKWSKKYKYLLVDEFQDTNDVQYYIVKVLSQNAHITIVGDPDQTIYSWRGASVDLMINFDQDFTNCKTIKLSQNYRSTKKIVEAANNLISYNKNRLDKKLYTENVEGEDIEYFRAYDTEAEAKWVVNKINELKKKKNQLKSIAIFYRSNYYSRTFEEELVRANINHKIYGGERFFERKEVKDVLAFLRVLYDKNFLSLDRVINIPTRGIGSVSKAKLFEYAEKFKKSNNEEVKVIDVIKERINHIDFPIKGDKRKQLFKFVKNILKYSKLLKEGKICKTLDEFLEQINYYKYIEDQSSLRGAPINNVNELISSIKAWENENKDKSVREYLEHVALMTSTTDEETTKNYISLMTIHSAKGLQFDNVFIVGMTNDVFPAAKARSKDYFSDEAQKMEEERRLAYVAITRAKKRLFLSDCRGYNYQSETSKTPSYFLKEMGVNIHSSIPKTLSDELEPVEEELSLDDERDLYEGDIVSHSKYGEGIIKEVVGDTVIIDFGFEEGEKQILKNHSSFKLLRRREEI